jgi:deoxyribodipyrimidine photolyase-related protein
MKKDAVLLILGDQLFAAEHLAGWEGTPVFMAEDRGLASRTRHHRIKLAFFFAAMRGHARALKAAGYAVRYSPIDGPDADAPFETKLLSYVRGFGAKSVRVFEIEDKFFEARIAELCRREGLKLEVRRSPMFLTSRAEFAEYLARARKPFLKDFYEQSRRRLGVLVTAEGEPVGGRWSLDAENRETLPRDFEAPPAPRWALDQEAAAVAGLVDREFPEHPGAASDLWLPTTRAGWLSWLDQFIDQRLADFGPYEDALSDQHDVIAHSVLTPALNCGLLTPGEVLARTLAAARRREIPLRSLEGFVRQLIGWREFVRGVYQGHSERQDSSNHWGHRRTLASCWRDGTTGLPPVDAAIRKALRLGWTHHIERLMVLSNAMFLCETDPREAHRWFMEMFVDSADWVMGPNVYGMGQNSDGGLMTTKPYICGSNYLRKMGRYEKGEWCDVLDGLYWRFVLKHHDALVRNPRTATAARAAERLVPARREKILAAAEAFLVRATGA